MYQQHDFPGGQQGIFALNAALQQLTCQKWIIERLAARLVGAEDAADDQQRNQHRRDNDDSDDNALPDRQPFQWFQLGGAPGLALLSKSFSLACASSSCFLTSINCAEQARPALTSANIFWLKACSIGDCCCCANA